MPTDAIPLEQLLATAEQIDAEIAAVPDDQLLAALDTVLRGPIAKAVQTIQRLGAALRDTPRVPDHLVNLINTTSSCRIVIAQEVAAAAERAAEAAAAAE